MASAMRKVSTRNLLAHKVRLVLTVLAVVLGTAFLAGSMIFTSTVKSTFDGIFDKVAIGVDTQISPKARDAEAATGRSSGSITAEQLALLKQQQQSLGVAKMVDTYSGPIAIKQADGGPITSGGAPSIGSAWVPPENAVEKDSGSIVEGVAPKVVPDGQPIEFVLNQGAADRGKLKVGSVTTLAFTTGKQSNVQAKLVGIFSAAGQDSGYTEARFDPEVAKKAYSVDGSASAVQLAAAPGVTPEQLQQRVQNLKVGDKPVFSPEFYQVQTGDEVRQANKDSINQFLNVFNYILIAFAGIGLLVGVFIIYNTFSMIIAQRIKELALLRAVGASKQQIMRSVLFEAFIVGLIGAAIGFAVGVGVAALLQTFTSSSGLPQGGLKVWGAVIPTLVVGVLVTMVSAFFPARRAAKVAPVEAMRESAAEPKSLAVRTTVGAVFFVAAMACVLGGTTQEGTGAAMIVAVGALLTLLAALLLAPAVSRPVIRVLSLVVAKPFGKIGFLARTNATRNPRRSAATAFALMLGLILVAVIGTLGASLKGTIDDAVDQNLRSDLVVTGLNNGPVNPTIADKISKTEGVTDVVAMRQLPFRVDSADGEVLMGTTAAKNNVREAFDYETVDGAQTVPAQGLLISTQEQKAKGWKVGQQLTIFGLSGKQITVPVSGVFDDKSQSLGSNIVGSAVYEQLVPQPEDSIVFVKTVSDVSAVQQRVEAATKDDLTVKVQDRQQFKQQAGDQVDMMLNVLYAMLALSLVVAVLGIINTLALSVIERRREIGMLRAVGTSRPQVRRMIYIESVLISIFGAVTGTALGCLIGWALVRTFRSEGITSVVLPWGQIGFTLIAAAIIGVLAAAWPAIRAARTKPLEAIDDV